MSAFRILSEMFRPSSKCERLGHKLRIEWRRGFVRPKNWSGSVCDAAEQERDVCRRCGEPQSEWRFVSRRGRSGYSWPSDMAREFNDKGEVWDESGFRSIAAPGGEISPAPNE